MYLTVQETFANLFDDHTFEQLTLVGETLEKSGVNTVKYEITNIIQQDYTPDSMRADIVFCFNDALRSVLLQYGIKINDELADSTFKLHQVLLLVLAIEENENHEDLLAITESANDPIDILIELNEYLKITEFPLVMEVVDRIHPIFITRITDYFNSKIHEADGDDGSAENDRVKRFFTTDLGKALGDNPVICVSEMQYGVDFDSLMGLVEEVLLRLPPRKLAANAVLCGLISDLPSEKKVNETLRVWLERRLDDPRKLIEVLGFIQNGNVGYV